MVDYLLRCAVRPDQPRPSIETLLHAFIPAPHVDHTHPDAVIALTSTPDGRRLAEKAFGDEAVWLDYQRPGFRHVASDRAPPGGEPGRARGAAGEARARHVGRDERGELPSHARVRRPSRPGDRRGPPVDASDWAVTRSRSSGRERGSPSSRGPFPRSAVRCSPTRTASSSRSTGARRRWRSPRPSARPR